MNELDFVRLQRSTSITIVVATLLVAATALLTTRSGNVPYGPKALDDEQTSGTAADFWHPSV